MTRGPGRAEHDTTRRELVLMVRAWLEQRDIQGLDRVFRATVTTVGTDRTQATESSEGLHALLDQALADVGLVVPRTDPG